MTTDDDKRVQSQNEDEQARRKRQRALEQNAADYKNELRCLAEFLKRRNDFQNRINENALNRARF